MQRKFAIRDLLKSLGKEGNPRLLNYAVQQAKREEADHINNGGFKKQLDYLIEQHDLPKVIPMIDAAIQRSKEHKEMARQVMQRHRLADLVSCLYFYKASEADGLAMSEVSDMVAYVLRQQGGIERLESFLEGNRHG